MIEETPEKDAHEGIIVQILQGIRHLSDNHVVLLTNQKEQRVNLEKHVTEEMAQWEKFNAKLEILTAAFPDSDLRGHREYHDALIASAQQRVKLRQAVIEKSLTALIWAGLVWISIAVWNAFKHSLGLG